MEREYITTSMVTSMTENGKEIRKMGRASILMHVINFKFTSLV
jgi:hypothetical protein